MGLGLLGEVRQVIEGARRPAAHALNAELTLSYWQVGQRIQSEMLKDERAEYGQRITAGLAVRLTVLYGCGWSEKQLLLTGSKRVLYWAVLT